MKRWSVVLLAFAASACGSRANAPLFYYDLGPDAVDVSGYPPDAKQGYEVFRAKCSACHTLARPINAPYNERSDWESYLRRMLFKGSFSRQMTMTDNERLLLEAFLDYDSQERKVRHREAFLKQQKELEDRFLSVQGR